MLMGVIRRCIIGGDYRVENLPVFSHQLGKPEKRSQTQPWSTSICTSLYRAEGYPSVKSSRLVIIQMLTYGTAWTERGRNGSFDVRLYLNF